MEGIRKIYRTVTESVLKGEGGEQEEEEEREVSKKKNPLHCLR